MSGAISLPEGAKPAGKATVYVSDGDCLAADAHILEKAQVSELTGGFFVESFPNCGSMLTVCAAFSDSEGAPSTWYGKSESAYKAEGTGEIYVSPVPVPVKSGPPHRFPARAASK